MTDVVTEPVPPRAHARIVYLGPVSPHWEVYGDWGERQVLDEFRARVLARLVLLPREDPQFRRNRERVVRDAEREAISIEWDLGVMVPQQTSSSAASPTPSRVDTEPAAEAGAVPSDAAPSDDAPSEGAPADGATSAAAPADEAAPGADAGDGGDPVTDGAGSDAGASDAAGDGTTAG